GHAISETKQLCPEELPVGHVNVEGLFVTDALLDPCGLDRSRIEAARKLAEPFAKGDADRTIKHVLRRLTNISDGPDTARFQRLCCFRSHAPHRAHRPWRQKVDCIRGR